MADNAKQQFFNLTSCAKAKLNEKFEKFTENGNHLGDFYSHINSQDKSYKDLWFVIKIVFIFSHVQASVESGFSINSSIMVENLQEESLVAQRFVYDSTNSLGGIKKNDSILINNKMLKSVKDANRHDKAALEKRKEADKKKKRKMISKKEKTRDE